MTIKNLAWLSALLIAVSCSRRETPPETEASALRVPVRIVRHEPVARIYEASGALRSVQTAVVTSKLSGYVREVSVHAGDHVAAHQTLVVLEGKGLEAGLRSARAAVAEARQAQVEATSALEAAQARAVVAQSTYERFQSLEEKRAVTAHEMDEVESRHRAAQADRSAAKARVARALSFLERARAEEAAAEAMFGDTRLLAPFAGRISERHVDAGNLAVPGTPLLVLEQEGLLRAEVSVDESQAGNIRPGDAATVFAASRTFTGKVSEVFPAVDPLRRAFLVKVDLPEDVDAEQLLPGRFVRVGFHVGTEERMLIPESAVVRRGQLELVYVVEEGKARLRLVTLGRVRDGSVEVLSGLNDGDEVIEQAGQIAKEGLPVIAAS